LTGEYEEVDEVMVSCTGRPAEKSMLKLGRDLGSQIEGSSISTPSVSSFNESDLFQESLYDIVR
jgi:hypothetical protein